MNICPVNAISMVENSEGFLYPKIDYNKCIDCGKCEKTCPVIYPEYQNNVQPRIYAATANDEIREKSSSGGIFSVIAEKILDENGVVCGARFDEDFREVYHYIVKDKNELGYLRGSKYVQSSIGYTYKEIKEYLVRGVKVLFSGCGCQVAGLKKFLEKDYDNLYTIDILCHGVPSPLAFKKYLDSVVLKEYPDEKIVDFQFRKKDAWGWAHSIYARLENGYVYSKSKNDSSWYPSFLNNLNCRESCGDCKFNKMPRQGDITLGDLWGIDLMSDEWKDGKGTSVVSANSEKGQILLDSISEKFCRYEEISLDIAKKNNGNLVGSSVSHRNRKRFFKLLNQYDDYSKTTEYALKRKFDIGYVGWWYGRNYGSVMTNFALQQYLESLGYSVLMLEWPEHNKPFPPVEDSFSRRFGNKYYEVSMRRTYEELHDLNWFCDMFIVGSDQLWNYWSTKENGAYFFLDFVDDSKKKIAYATSFGHAVYGAPKHILEKNSFHLSRFDAISVREEDGVDLCKDVFGVDAEWMIEPVFLLSQKRYIEIANDSSIETPEKYIFAYILSPSEEKRSAILKMARETGLPLILILDAQANHENNRRIMNMPESLRENLEMEDWLKYIMNATIIVTDSFHGTCFSIIYEKQFVCIGNAQRGLSRFNSLLKICDLDDKMVLDPLAINKEIYSVQIDYDNVNQRLQAFVDKSKTWLNNVLMRNKACKLSTYDMLNNKIKELENKIRELEKK